MPDFHDVNFKNFTAIHLLFTQQKCGFPSPITSPLKPSIAVTTTYFGFKNTTFFNKPKKEAPTADELYLKLEAFARILLLHFINETSLKTSYFGLKPSKWLIFNSPALKGGVIDIRDNQGFSHIS